MPSTTAIKGCYSSCAWRSDPLPHPGSPLPPNSQVIIKDNQQKSNPHPRLGQSLSRKWEHYIYTVVLIYVYNAKYKQIFAKATKSA